MRKNFERQTLDEHYDKPDIINLRLNREERMMLEVLKLCYNEKNDSTAIKKEAFRVLKQNRYLEELSRK